MCIELVMKLWFVGEDVLVHVGGTCSSCEGSLM